MLLVVACLPAKLPAQSATESILHGFSGSDGTDPWSLVQASDGNFYGTTVLGGSSAGSTTCVVSSGCGTIFQITSAGVFTVLYNFTGGTDGGLPNPILEGSDGNFYGTANIGGSGDKYGYGTFFQITPGGNFTVLYTFTDGSDGAYPNALTLGNDGNFYGTTETTVFKIALSGALTPLYTFTGGSDGSTPYPIIQGSDGNFYGITEFGGSSTCFAGTGCGTVFSMTPAGSLTTIYTFNYGDGTSDAVPGAVPGIVIPQPTHPHNPGCPDPTYNSSASGMVEGANGLFYGATLPNSKCVNTRPHTSASIPGILFSITSAGSLTTLYTSTNTGEANFSPSALTLGSDGNLYGANLTGGTGDGSIFQAVPGGALTSLYGFCSEGESSCPDGSFPGSNLVQGSDGNFYGSTSEGGASDDGTIYRLNVSSALAAPVQLTLSSPQIGLSGSVTLSWQILGAYSLSLQQCYAFVQNNASGAGAWTGLQSGTISSGIYSGSATITPTANGVYTYALTCGGQESGFATLLVGGAPQLTITTASLPGATTGASYSAALAASGGVPPYMWSISSGSLPTGLTLNSSTGQISGTPAQSNGASFLISVADAEGTPQTATANLGISVAVGTLEILTTGLPTAVTNASYTAALEAAGGVTPYTWSISSGSLPAGLNLNASTGVISGITAQSGTTSFTIQVSDSESTPATVTASLTIGSNYPEDVFYSFTDGNDGAEPKASPIQGSDGNLHGTAELGGANAWGTLYQITPSETLTTEYSFCAQSNCTDGAEPTAIIQGSDGNYYGITSDTDASGVLFKFVPPDSFTILYTFCSLTDCTDGATPVALIQGNDANFYGVTSSGGATNFGTVFKITPTGVLTTLYNFCSQYDSSSEICLDGNSPNSLIQGSDGNFYGTTISGGANGNGSVFRVTSSSVLTTIYSFCSQHNSSINNLCTDGVVANALIEGSNGSLYGTTAEGGSSTYCGQVGCGTVFTISSSGTLTTLYNFCIQTNCPDGSGPNGLIQGSDGYFYGTTGGGGANNFGSIFKLTSTGVLTSLYGFCTQANCGDGEIPTGLLQGSDGNFYGATYAGGAFNDGALYRVTPSPALKSPVQLSLSPSSVSRDGAFTLSYTVANASSNTLQYCFATNTAGNTAWTGVHTGKTTAQTASLTAPPTSGTYTYALTCGGVETGFATLTVASQYASGTVLVATPNPVVMGQSVKVTATVSGAGPAPTGTVSFIYGEYVLGTGKISSGAASLTYSTSGVPAGDYIVTAAYSGDSNYSASTSPGYTVIISAGLDSAVTLSAAPNPATIGQSVTGTATVTGSGPTPTGTVSFVVEGDVLATVKLSSGTASYAAATSGVPAGSYTATAIYSGDSNYKSSTSPGYTVILKYPTSTTLTANPSTVTPPNSCTLTAAVTRTSSGATGAPGGTVTFYFGTQSLGTEAVNASGIATLPASSNDVPAGNYQITAKYNGDSVDVGSTSPAATVTVE